VTEGFTPALNGKNENPPIESKLDGKGEAKLIAVAFGEAPKEI